MYCAKCGTQILEGDGFCKNCGSQLIQPQTPIPVPTSIPAATPASSAGSAGTTGIKRTSGLAVASLVLGILGISILAIIFGGIAMSQTGKDPNLSGRGMAIAGLILGIIGLVAGFMFIAFIFLVSTAY